MVQAAAVNELSGRKSVSAKSRVSARRPSLDNALRLQPSLAPSVETRCDQSPTSVFHKEVDTRVNRNNLGRTNAFRSNSSQPSTKSSDTSRGVPHGRRMSNTSINSSTDPESDNMMHQRKMIRRGSVARRWSAAATNARMHARSDMDDEGVFMARDRGVARRKSCAHFETNETYRELNDLKETSPIDADQQNANQSPRAPTEIIESEGYSEGTQGQEMSQSDNKLSSSPREDPRESIRSPYYSSRKSSTLRADRKPSTSDSDSIGRSMNKNQMQVPKSRTRPNSRQNFKISRPTSRQAVRREISSKKFLDSSGS